MNKKNEAIQIEKKTNELYGWKEKRQEEYKKRNDEEI